MLPSTLKQIVDRACAEALVENWHLAAAGFGEVLRRGDTRAVIYQALGTCEMQMGRGDRAIATYRQALTKDPTLRTARNNLIMLVNLHPDTTNADAYAERRAWWVHRGEDLARRPRAPFTNDCDPERPLRVGYVSGDFRAHSAAYSFGPVTLRHSPGVQPVFYAQQEQQQMDEVTALFAQRGPIRPIVPLTTEHLAALIREDQIDILVDLSGHSAANRLEVFCLKPAPIQVHGWGYAAGSGLDTMDVMFADAYVLPQGERRHFTERIVDLPSILPYCGPPPNTAVNALPMGQTGRVSFASLNQPNKIHPAVLALWARILRAVPGSRLVLKAHGYDEPEISSAVRAAFDHHGVGIGRVDIRGTTKHQEHLETYHRIDLSLDPWPQTGGISALESLWMGVPMVTWPGDRLCSRLSASFLTTLDLPGFIAESAEEYVRAAVWWVTEGKGALAELRAGLRDHLLASPINTGYVVATEAAYRDLWRAWCADQRRA